jgi:SAM-dependent methyltransferase
MNKTNMEIKISDGASKSHIAHKNHIDKLISEKENRLFPIKNQDCVSYKLNKRTLDILEPFWSNPGSWLTIADYNGLEANYLQDKSQNVLASDISDAFLKESKSERLIEDFRIINVERIDFDDNSFDYVSCRESFHHFPRAYLGLYEMIRVSKKASIIVEPIDVLTRMPLLLLVKNILDRFNPLLINKFWKNRFSFETVGNYVFKISEREVEKIAMGIGLRLIAFKGINILLSVKEDTLEIPLNQKLWTKLQGRLRIKDLFCRLKIVPYNNICCVIFKEYPDESVLQKMKAQGFKIIPLPENPYLT